MLISIFFFFSSRRRHTRFDCDWSSDVCSSDLNLALAYDSASILTENDNPEADAGVIVPLSGYRQVMTAALAYLDSAIAIASGPAPTGPTGDWFPLPATWVNGDALTGGATGTLVQL